MNNTFLNFSSGRQIFSNNAYLNFSSGRRTFSSKFIYVAHKSLDPQETKHCISNARALFLPMCLNLIFMENINCNKTVSLPLANCEHCKTG